MLLQRVEGGSFPPVPAPRTPWRSLACSRIHCSDLCLVFTRSSLSLCFLSLIRWSGMISFEILNLPTFTKTLFQIRSHSQVPGVRTWTNLLGPVQPLHHSICYWPAAVWSFVFISLLPSSVLALLAEGTSPWHLEFGLQKLTQDGRHKCLYLASCTCNLHDISFLDIILAPCVCSPLIF